MKYQVRYDGKDLTMQRTWLLRGMLLIALLGLVTTGAALAGVLPFTLDWWTVDGGGASSTGGPYALSGTIGQPDAGVSTGGAYTLGGGFWRGGELQVPQEFVYLPVMIR